MNAWVFVLLPTALGVDFGWERQPDNSIEYIVQIEPEAVDQMKTGTELISALPPQLKNIRNYRIRVGRDRLPNQNVLPPEVAGTSSASTNTGTSWGTTSTPGYNTATSGGTSYPAGTGTNFANSSLPNRPGSNYPSPNPSGTGPTYYAGTTTGGTSTSGFPMQPTGTQYAPNTGTSYPPTYNTGTYPPNTTGSTGYTAPGTNSNWNTPNYAGSQPTQYVQPGYNQPNYPQPGYPAGYAQPGYGPGGPQYVAANPSGAAPNLPDPNYYIQQGMQTAKPSIEMPNPSGTQPPPGYGPAYAGSAQGGFAPNASGYPNNGQAPLNANDQRFVNTAEPRTPTDASAQSGVGTAKAPVESQSQWASLTFALIGLFASLGANFYLGWTTYHLRERYRMMLSDRVTY